MSAWKSIRISKPCKLSIEDSNLVLVDDSNKIKFSLDDTDSIIFEGDHFTLTAPVLSALAKYKVATIFCDEYYMPLAILLPYKQSALGVDVLKLQISISDDLKASLWQVIIESKILNQADVLNYFNYNSENLYKYIGSVFLNDKHNFEAKSARSYWKELFPRLKREQESIDVRNQALNYAYAIFRSMISRDLSVSGFNCALGIWHDNKYNPYNLSDDLMEPFRPIIDIAIKKYINDNYDIEYLSPEVKRYIISIFDKEYVRYNGGISSIRKISKLFVNDFKKVIFENKIEFLQFPTIYTVSFDECF